MTWDKLVDRCLLFTDAPGGLLKALLKEAEQELSNRLELYDSIYTLEVPNTDNGLGLFSSTPEASKADHNYHKLPTDYIRDIAVFHEGRRLIKMSDEDFYRQSNDQIPSGTPTAYGISGDYIVFNATPQTGDTFIIHYKSELDDSNTDKVLTLLHYDVQGSSTDYVWLDTTLTSLLDGYTFTVERTKYLLSAGTSGGMSVPPGLPDRLHSNMYENKTNIVSSVNFTKGSRYNIVDVNGGSAATSAENLTGGLGSLLNYRTVAPVIPERLHKNLCPYAIALANAKSAPELYDKHITTWELTMERLINEARDRDLIYSIREEI